MGVDAVEEICFCKMTYMKVIDYPEASRELKEIYDELIGRRGKRLPMCTKSKA
jgi:hypothetical protein